MIRPTFRIIAPLAILVWLCNRLNTMCEAHSPPLGDSLEKRSLSSRNLLVICLLDRDGHVLVDIEHTHVHLTILVRSHSTCRRASARAAVATGPAAACAAATCARAAVATCAAAACLRRIHQEGQHWSTQRQVHRPVRPALSPQHARAASAYRHGRACSMLRGCTLS